jgi:hypothetical protein
MNRLVALASALVVATSLVGCSQPTNTVTFDLTIHNQSPTQVFAVLTKDGGPADEPGWASPEQYAMTPPEKESLVVSGVVIPPGKTASATKTGKFYVDSRAMLRIYQGKPTLDELLATSVGPLRKDVALDAGKSTITIENAPTVQLKVTR